MAASSCATLSIRIRRSPPGPRGTAQLFLGQQPQVSFRPLTVHFLSVPGPSARCQRPALDGSS
jgi:hypothetical protein